MSNKINAKTVSVVTLDKFSKYNVAYIELVALRKWFKDKNDELVTKKNDVIKMRQNAVASGECATMQEASEKYSISAIVDAMEALKNEYETKCAPHKEAQKEVRAMVGDDVYPAYALAQKTGKFSATGVVAIGDTEYTVNKSYRQLTVDFATKCDFANTSDAKACDKFAQFIYTSAYGMQKDSKGNYLKLRSKSQIQDLFILAVLKYCIVEKAQWATDEKGNITIA